MTKPNEVPVTEEDRDLAMKASYFANTCEPKAAIERTAELIAQARASERQRSDDAVRATIERCANVAEARAITLRDEGKNTGYPPAWEDRMMEAEVIARDIRSLLEERRTGAWCHDCSRPYGHEHGFPDLIIPFAAWRQITPTEDDGGLLCPSCICKRLHDVGLRCEGAFMSGPIISVTSPTMNALRRVENIELAIKGRDNSWSAIRSLLDKQEG